MFYMKEIIGADERCTNLSLSSVGVCVNEPAMNQMDIEYFLKKSFGEKNIYTYHKFFKNGEWWFMVRADHEAWDKLERRILFKEISTISRFLNYIKSNKANGHYIIGVSGHSLAVHYLKSGRMFIVDNEEQFISRKRLEFINIVEDSSLDKVFLDFLENTNRPQKIKEV